MKCHFHLEHQNKNEILNLCKKVVFLLGNYNFAACPEESSEEYDENQSGAETAPKKSRNFNWLNSSKEKIICKFQQS